MAAPPSPTHTGTAREVFYAFLRLGCLSFGGPIAHLGYFHTEFVERRNWCDEQTFAEIVALAQSMPGPASSQVGFALGLLRAGWPGGLAAWLGFTMPSALLMLAFAFGHRLLTGKLGLGIVHGLQLVAVAVVAQAILTMRKSLAPDLPRVALALLAAAVALFAPPSIATLLAIAAGALLGYLSEIARPTVLRARPKVTRGHNASARPKVTRGHNVSARPKVTRGCPTSAFFWQMWDRREPPAGEGKGLPLPPLPLHLPPQPSLHFGLSKLAGLLAATSFLALPLLVPLATKLTSSQSHGAWPQSLAVFNAFFRTGALVFGGGHVVLPLLENAVVAPGWVNQPAFLSGYGAAQALPGPLFTFAAYLGAVVQPTFSRVALSALALIAIFLPGLLIIVAVLPFWNMLRQRPLIQSSLRGVNAAVIGVLIAAFIRPVWSSAVHSAFDLAVALAAFALLVRWKVSPWIVVIAAASVSAIASIL